MPGKALAGAFALGMLAALVGCGGSDGTSQANEEAQRFRDRVQEVQQQRQSRVAEATARSAQHEPARTTQKDDHRDSGGGAAQFRGEGDNSVQVFGREASGDERQRAAAVLHGYLDAQAARRWVAACGYVSASLIVTLERVASHSRGSGKAKGCADVLALLSRRTAEAVLREAADADIGSMRMEGDRSFLLYHGARGMDYAMPMVLEAGGWKVATLAGAPLP